MPQVKPDFLDEKIPISFSMQRHKFLALEDARKSMGLNRSELLGLLIEEFLTTKTTENDSSK